MSKLKVNFQKKHSLKRVNLQAHHGGKWGLRIQNWLDRIHLLILTLTLFLTTNAKHFMAEPLLAPTNGKA